jgi:hypothetical protein
MKLLFIQTSPFHTCSTLLVNSLYGIIPECSTLSIRGTWSKNVDKDFKNIIILKSHNTNIDELIKKYKNYKTVFICSERKNENRLIDKKYKKYNNVVVFSFKELNETANNTLNNIVENIYKKIKKVLPNNIVLDKETCIKRINDMNIRYEEIKDKPFTYIDPFFEIHGSHRDRGNI